MKNQTIGIKLADGTFYPILEEGSAAKKMLELTTAQDGQTTVQVHLYRSASASMEDAEYVDTLLIEQIAAQEKEKPTLPLVISLDEDGMLSAEITDTESGKHAGTKISLVSLDEKDISPAFGYDAALSPEAENPENSIEEDISAQEADSALSADDIITDISLPDFDIPPLEELEDISENAETIAADSDFSGSGSGENAFAAEDFGTTAAEAEQFASSEIELPSFDANDFADSGLLGTDDTIQNDTDETVFDEKEDFESDLPPLDDDFLLDHGMEPAGSEMPELDISSAPDPAAAKTAALSADNDNDTDAFDTDAGNFGDMPMPDFDELSEDDAFSDGSGGTQVDELLPEESAFPSLDDFSLPQESEDAFQTETLSAENAGDNSEEDFSSPFDFEKELDDSIPSPSISFSDLYDEERIQPEEEEPGKKSPAALICILCALISVCILLVILFFAPGILLRSKTSVTETVIMENPAQTEAVPIPTEPAVHESEPAAEPEQPQEIPVPIAEAESNEIVAVETPIVEPAPVKPAAEQPQDVSYRIKWGDTLWDIAETYYRNPWEYKRIARYNRIRNPDLIISGTYITIPAK
ncbi:MAG: LysM peptidoglycan-binding domain-containing protein [Bacteroides sp.]|nr:LysM peptidoglycan-binding domain-containing protein [Prevotella sp.]MCM1408613.1 LysM peptidoglycan-binding domain-containing protein [Treponema brennaborense]MCM1468899.1 LysM peptidoglycan-binding domain-containing protein [Bacteroides sp.]